MEHNLNDEYGAPAVTILEMTSNFYPTIENINEDCLRYIFEFLNLFDAVNLAATCESLLNYAKAAVFPKKAKQIKIECSADETSVIFYAPNFHYLFLSLDWFETLLRYFGETVEIFIFDNFVLGNEQFTRCLKIVTAHCKYLNTLGFNECEFSDDISKLPSQIESFQYLTELSFFQCTGVTTNWPATQKTSKVQKLSLETKDKKICVNFFQYFGNLVSLTIPISHTGRAADFETTFDPIRNCLEHLRFVGYGHREYENRDYHYIANWIANLPKLKSLKCQGEFKVSLKHLIQSPHLKCLHIYFGIRNLNLLFPALSEIGSIEELKIHKGQLTDEDSKNTVPLIFNRLHTFHMLRWHNKANMASFLKTVKMPAIQSFVLNDILTEEFPDLLVFLKSNLTLKSITLAFKNPKPKNFEFFMLQIIGIFKEHSTPARPFVNMKIYPSEFHEKYVS